MLHDWENFPVAARCDMCPQWAEKYILMHYCRPVPVICGRRRGMIENVLNLVTPCLTERLVEVYEKSGEYQELTEKENRLLEQLNSGLTKEQIELLNKYMTAVNSTYAVCEKLAYQQGMRDCAALFTSLVSQQ